MVGDITMAELLPALEQAFGSWLRRPAPKPTKNLAAATPAAKPRDWW